MKRISMQDVADELGISKATVSLVLNGKAKGSRVSEGTCKKVLNMVKKLNYQPNEIARSLSTGMSMTIGVVVTDISNEFFGKLTFYIQERAKQYGYSVITVNTNENLEEFDNAITMLLKKQIDCIIFVPVFKGEKIIKKIMDSNIPMVQIDRFYPSLKTNYIVVDNYKVSYKAIEKLINSGCKKISTICYDIDINALRDRKQGSIDVLKHYSLYDKSLVKNISYNNQDYDLKKAITDLSKRRNEVDAVFFCSIRVFIGGLKYMYKEKIKIPEEMQVLCFDRIDTYSFANFPIMYIEQPIKEMGEKAVDIIMKQVRGESNGIEQCILKANIGYSTS